MLAALKNSPDSLSMSSLKDYIDPNMMDLYPHDCLFKVTFTVLVIMSSSDGCLWPKAFILAGPHETLEMRTSALISGTVHDGWSKLFIGSENTIRVLPV